MAVEIPLVNRYHAAWLEHGTRVAQRQNCIQIYLASVGVVFGFYATAEAKNQATVAPLLLAGVSFLTIASALLIYMHLRVMQHLCDFMMRCEKFAAEGIRTDGSGTDELFCFYSGKSGEVADFHHKQRLLHRSVIAAMLLVTNFAVISLTWSYLDHVWFMFVVCVVLPVVLWALLRDLIRDKKDA